MKKVIFSALLWLALAATPTVQAQNAVSQPSVQTQSAVNDLGNGPEKVRVVQGSAFIFTSQGSGTGSTSGSSTSLTLTATPPTATAPCVGCQITGTGITAGTTVTAASGTSVTLSAAMTVSSGTALTWGAACPASLGSTVPYMQATASSDFWPVYSSARICALTQGGPNNWVLTQPFTVSSLFGSSLFSLVANSPLSGGGSPSLGSSTSLSCPTCVTSSGGGAITGVAPMSVSVAGAVSLSTANGIGQNVLNTQTANYTIQTTDCGKTIQAGTGSSGFFAITVPSVSGFPSTCVVTIANGDASRWKAISGFGGCSSQNVIAPGQACTIGIVNGAWTALSRPGRYRPPASTTINFFTDFVNGSDTPGATDGLGTGAAAFKSVEHCQLFAADQIDFNTASQTQVKCNMAAATADTQGMHTPVHALTGAQGGAAFQVVGASLSISGAISNAGACEITVPSTSTYSANEVVSVYGIGGATGCNGAWQVTVTDSTHLTLQSTTFGGAYTSGGTVTNGSSFNTTSVDDIDCYFGTVFQFYNVTFISNQNGLAANWGCKVYFQAGNIFGSIGGADLYANYGGSQIHFEADVGIAASATNAFAQIQHQGLLIADAAASLNFVPGINPSFSGLGFVYADTQGQGNFLNVTINTNSNTVTGPRCAAATLGLIVSGSGSPNTYFPGNSNCTAASGAVVN